MPEFFPNLFAPIRIGRLALRNRICLTGHGTGMGRDFKPDDRQIAYYAERARGGVALIMLGSQQVHPTSPGMTNLLCNYDDGIIPGLARIADAVHAHGAKILGYLSHMGIASSARPLPLWSASAVHDQKYGEVAHAMTLAEMVELTAAYVAAARRNLAAGLDGIEVHCGHGLLLHQFLSPLTNRRVDAYGGSLENRARFPAEVLAAVRSAIGADTPLGIRISADELTDGGFSVVDTARIVPLLVAAGRLDFVDVSAGNDGDVVSNMLHEPPMGLPDAPFANLAAALRAVAGVPVIHGTRVRNAEVAERVLAAGAADMVGMCRALIADPHLPNKARDGRAAETTPCVGCQQACFGRLHRGKTISCVGNPRSGREVEWPELSPAPAPRRVVVVGGGPAGLEAAIVAAARGHRVVLFERGARLGGRLALAGGIDARKDWLDLIAHKVFRASALGVDIRLGITASPEAIRAEHRKPRHQPREILRRRGVIVARERAGHEILARREAREHAPSRRHLHDSPPHDARRIEAVDRFAVEPDGAGCGFQLPADAFQQRALAGAVMADQRDRFAGGQFDRQLIQHDVPPVAGDQRGHLQQGGHAAVAASRPRYASMTRGSAAAASGAASTSTRPLSSTTMRSPRPTSRSRSSARRRSAADAMARARDGSSARRMDRSSRWCAPQSTFSVVVIAGNSRRF